MTKADAKVSVALGSRSYEIDIGHGLLARSGAIIAPFLKRPSVVIVTDENVAKHHLKALESGLSAASIASQVITVPAGEKTKSFEALAELCDSLLAVGVERRDLVIALGGGVIGDLVGFATSILRRGVNFIQVPTTLLAQVDSSVGGKTGINSKHGKNLIGAFHQPLHVIADLGTLATLPKRELAAGYAEVAKYGLLGDKVFYEWLESNVSKLLSGDPLAMRHTVQTCCATKARIVAEDETETGVRALLNLGHTFGHALEAATGYSSRLLHGEAVAIGTVQAFRFSEQLGLCAKGQADRIALHLRTAGLPTHRTQIPGELPQPSGLLALMHQDKKAVGGKLTFILAKGIGEAFIARDVDEAKVLTFLEWDIQTR
jgi:3-dehydroquinate synthase